MRLKDLLVFPFLFLLFPQSFAQCYELVWSEEFDYWGLPDPDVWTFEEGAEPKWGNNELQYYKSGPGNAFVDSGKLVITAREEDHMGSSYTSARLTTSGKVSHRYGKIEASLKLPQGQGIWPAFWMLGESVSQVGWPACGEIDIMEMIGGTDRDNQVHATLHWADASGNHAQFGRANTLSNGIFADTFHVFAIEWTPDVIRWFLDGQQYHVIDISPPALSEFQEEFNILLNIAVGGDWPGSPDSSTTFPQTMQVDYLRVYKLDERPEIKGDTLTAVNQDSLVFTLPYHSNWTYQWSVPEDAEIMNGQGTHEILVKWGCTDGLVNCLLNGTCGEYSLERKVHTQFEPDGPMFIDENEQGIVISVPYVDKSIYSWSVPEDAVIVSGDSTHSIVVNWGKIYGLIYVSMENNCGVQDTTLQTWKTGQYPYPDPDQPHLIPGVIEAVDYDYGGEGLAYHDLTNYNEGPGPRQDEQVDSEYNDGNSPNVGWILSGEWLEYTVSVDSSMFYSVELRVGTNYASGGPFRVLFNGREVLGDIRVNNTGGWDRFITLEAGNVYLETTDTLMRMDFKTGGFNIGKIRFHPASPVNVPEKLRTMQLNVFPTPASGFVTIMSATGIGILDLYDLWGRQVMQVNGLGKIELAVDVAHLAPGIYFWSAYSEGRIPEIVKMIKK
jgi:beta-glucanase (GH16 family)